MNTIPSIQSLIDKAAAKERAVSACLHLWEPQGMSLIDSSQISSMVCRLCGERRAPTEEENHSYANACLQAGSGERE